jgi:hypothetical protein
MKTNNNRGAALLVVVGLLALLLIATVSFSILMTVERSAANNYRHSVQARQMLYAGLAQAIADIDADVRDDAYPQWNNATITNGSRSVTRMADVFQSVDAVRTTEAAVCPVKVMSREAMQYIPRTLYRAVDTVQPEAMGFSVGGQTIGRYAYVAVNVSGLLDANIVGNTNFTRWTGTNAGEIQLADNVPFDVTNAAYFYEDRATIDKRYESIEELSRLNTGIASNKLSNFETFSYAPAAEYQPYADPDHKTNKIFIGGDAAQIESNKVRIVSAFEGCGVKKAMVNDAPAMGAEWAYLALIDYADTNSVPEGTNENEQLARPATEDVPQIQSVALVAHYERTGGYEHSITYNLYVKCSSPRIPGSYSVIAEATLGDSGTEPGWTDLLPWPDSNTVTWEDAITDDQIDAANAWCLSFPPGLFANISVPSTSAIPGKVSFDIDVSVKVKVATDAGTRVVDQVPMTGEFPLRFKFQRVFGTYNPEIENHAVWTEAVDPSINWVGYPLVGGQWVVSEIDDTSDNFYKFSLSHLQNDCDGFGDLFEPAAGVYTSAYLTWKNRVQNNSFGGVLSDHLLQNGDALTWWNTDPNNAIRIAGGPVVPDGSILGTLSTSWDTLAHQRRHYVKNGPLESVGELGFLNIGRWMTINLYSHAHNDTFGILPDSGFHPVLDFFTVRPTNGVVRGLVNLHSRNAQVHAAVYNQMPINEWLGLADPTISRIGPSDALTIGQWFTANAGSIVNLSDMGMLLSDPTAVTLAGAGEFEREGVIRNAAQLYTTRQQIYTIVVRADAMTFEYGGGAFGVGDTYNQLNAGSVLGSAQAVFQVWRDPVPDADGKHPCFVRLCKILSM